MDKFGYIGIAIGIFPLWFYMYLTAKRLRLRMRNSGIYSGVITVFSEPMFLKDYWMPPPLFGIENFYSLEDFIYSFLSAGIAIGIYNFIFKIEYKTIYPKRKKLSVLLTVGILSSLVILNVFFDYNSIMVISYSMIMATFIMIFLRPDLFIPALFSGILMIIVTTTLYMLLFNVILTSYWTSYWKLVGTPYEYYILGIPWTEYLWYFSLGFFVSIIYDFASGTAKR